MNYLNVHTSVRSHRCTI